MKTYWWALALLAFAMTMVTLWVVLHDGTIWDEKPPAYEHHIMVPER